MPTYKEFRTWALAQGFTGRTLAPYVQADEPLKTATRILVFLNGTHWDDEPLPYPKLCALYNGETAPAAALAPRKHVDLDDALVAGNIVKPEQCSVRHKFGDPYLEVELDPDAPREGFKTLAHLTGAKYLWSDERGPREIRFPYEVLCRVAARQCRLLGDKQEEIKHAAASSQCSLLPLWVSDGSARAPIDGVSDVSPAGVPQALAGRACACGRALAGRPDQRFCSALCRKRASRANPERIAKKRGVKRVTAISPFTPQMSRLLTPARRSDGSVRDVFTESPTAELLSRVSLDSKAFNDRVRMKYRTEARECPELFE